MDIELSYFMGYSVLIQNLPLFSLGDEIKKYLISGIFLSDECIIIVDAK